MSNAPKRKGPAIPPSPPRKKKRAGPEPGGRRPLYVVLGVAAGAVIVAVTAIVASSGGSSSPKEVNLLEIQPVEVSGAALPAFQAGQADAAVGQAAPRVNGKTFGSRSISIKSGKPTMLVFLSHWSPASQKQAPALVQWHHGGLAPEALQVISVITGSDPAKPNYPASSWLVDVEWPWSVVVDDTAQSVRAAYGFSDVPGIVLLDKDGVVRFRAQGELAVADLQPQLHSALGL